MSRLEQLEQLTALVEAIKNYEYYRAHNDMRAIKMQDMGLSPAYNKHRIEICTMVIARLESRYNRIINNLHKQIDK